MTERTLTAVWEAYKRDSQQWVMFKTKELAENQDLFESDLVTPTIVLLTPEEIERLNRGEGVTNE